MSDLEARIRSGLSEYADAAPVVTPPFSVPGRRGWLSPVLVAAAVLAVLALLPWLAPQGRPVADGGESPARLPARFPSYSFLTGDLAQAPLGRAVAAYAQRNDAFEDYFQDPQVLLLDGAQVRRARVGVDWQHPWLLSPDGRRIAYVAAGDGWLSILDVASGGVSQVAGGRSAIPLAWSPDSRTLAHGIPGGPLDLLDVGSGGVTGVARAYVGGQVAFSPDGSMLAIQAADGIRVVDRSGDELRRLSLQDDQRLSGPQAWSPDGTLLAVTRIELLPSRAGPAGVPRSLAFIDAYGPTSPSSPVSLPGEVPLQEWIRLLGWRSGRTVVLWDGTGVVEVPLSTAPRTTLARVGGETSQVQLASALIANLAIDQPATPVDRGPWPSWARTTVSLTLTLTALPILIWYALRRRSRR